MMADKNYLMYPFLFYQILRNTFNSFLNNIISEVSLPFPNPRLAQIAFDVLRVDLEPKRSTAQKEFFIDGNHLKLKLSAPNARQLRVALNSFFDNINLILQTMVLTGSPHSESYSHYSG